MAEINADAETVIAIMSEKLSRLEQENSILSARLLTAGKMLDEYEKNTKEPSSKKATR